MVFLVSYIKPACKDFIILHISLTLCIVKLYLYTLILLNVKEIVFAIILLTVYNYHKGAFTVKSFLNYISVNAFTVKFTSEPGACTILL